jgi:2-(1,2-epoxy-1,2-dihydrophenyl)acetyl-CoA isomerase
MRPRVRFEITPGDVGLVTLDRPDKRNAMDVAMFEGLHAAASACVESIRAGAVRAVLVIGAGQAFSAGLDVALFGEQVSEPPSDDWIAWLQQAFTAFEDLPVPTVAAVTGVAVGAGFQLALACHLRVASPSATFGLLEVRWGLLPDLGGLYRLPRLVGLGRATDLAVTGRTIPAATACSWGLVDAVLDAEDFRAAALDYTERIAAGPTVATGAIPGLLRDGLRAPREAALAGERRAQRACLSSGDFHEVVAAANEGRAPAFRGR